MGKHYTGTMVQVTKAMINVFHLANWEFFLQRKGFKTEVRDIRKNGQPVYFTLWRSLSDAEIVQLNAGKLKIKNNFLEFKADNSSKRRGSYK